jgi:hypothetical protein
MKPTILIYTHTDMVDVWPMFFSQFKKYIRDFEVYICLNRFHESIPNEYEQIIYDDNKSYTDRLSDVLPKIQSEFLLFMHEDMVLIDTPNFDLIEKYMLHITCNKADSIKLIYVKTENETFGPDETLICNKYSRFSIQPTLISKKYLISLCAKFSNRNIWDFEVLVPTNNRDFMSYLGTEKQRGIYHYDSKVWPYIATAIVKGKWNVSEYPEELGMMFEKYNVDPKIRGIR